MAGHNGAPQARGSALRVPPRPPIPWQDNATEADHLPLNETEALHAYHHHVCTDTLRQAPMTTVLAPTAVTTCEACWNAPVEGVRVTAAGTDLLCRACAISNYPRRVDLFPPLGVFGLTARKLEMGRHGSGSPQGPPDQGPPLPNPAPVPSPPGTPPV